LLWNSDYNSGSRSYNLFNLVFMVKSYAQFTHCIKTNLLYNINNMITAPTSVFDVSKGSFLFYAQNLWKF